MPSSAPLSGCINAPAAANLLPSEDQTSPSHNDLRYLRVGVDSIWEQEKPEARKMLAGTVPQAQVKMRQNLHRPLHALLARF